MLKNVKIDAETHRLLSMKAAQLSEQKGILCAVLIRAALQQIPEDTLHNLLSEFVTSDGCSGVKTVCQNQDQGHAVQR